MNYLKPIIILALSFSGSIGSLCLFATENNDKQVKKVKDELAINIGDNVAIGDNLKILKKKLEGFCTQVSIMENNIITYPLAKNSELHLVCNGYKKENISFAKVAFTLADNQFVQLQAHGVSVPTIRRLLGDAMGQYLEMDVYANGLLWLDAKNKSFNWVNNDGRHVHVFAWNNPYLSGKLRQTDKQSSLLPSWINFDKKLAELKPLFEKQCLSTKLDVIDKIWLTNKPKQQKQLNCIIPSYAGFTRKIEAVFGDEQLKVIWILTAKPEEHRIRRQLANDWGKPSIVNDVWEVFAEGKISLRKDKPEILVLADDMIPYYKDRFNLVDKQD